MRGLGQALEGIQAIGALASGAIVLFLVYRIGGFLLADAKAKAPGGYGGLVANDWFTTGLDVVLPATFLLLVFFGLVAAAVMSRQVVR